MTSQAIRTQDVCEPSRGIVSWPMVVVGVVAFAAFVPQLRFPFVYDDTAIVLDNPVVQDGPWYRSLTEPYWPAHISRDPLYRPVTTLTLRVQYALFGDEPFAFRLFNVFLHALCAAMVVRIGMRLSPLKCAIPAGLAAGLIFAAHPLNAEAVCLVVGRAELLAVCFGLVLIDLHVGGPASRPTRPIGWHISSTLLFLLAVGSKEHAVLLLPAVAMIDAARRPALVGSGCLRTWLHHAMKSHGLGLVLAATAFFVVRWSIFGQNATLRPDEVDPFANPLIGAGPIAQVATPFALLFLAMRLLIAPVGLCPIWSIGGFDVPDTLFRADVLAGAACALVILGVCVWSIKARRMRWLVPCLGGLFLLIPCHFLPAANWLFAERWLYLPSALLALFITSIGSITGARRCMFVVLPWTVVLFLGTWTYQQSWRSSAAMMQSVLDRQPDNYRGLIGYLHIALEEHRLAETEAEVLRLLDRFADSPRAWYYYALLMHEQGQPGQVLDAIRQWVRLTNPTPLPRPLREAQQAAQRAMAAPEG